MLSNYVVVLVSNSAVVGISVRAVAAVLAGAKVAGLCHRR